MDISTPIFLKRPDHRAGLPVGREETEGKGPAHVFLHCMLGSRRGWRDAIASLPPMRTISLDLPGHGETGHDSDRDYLGQSAAILEEILEETGPAHLVGHSFGGAVAAEVAYARPDLVRSLFLYEPVMFGIAEDAGHPAWPEERAFTETLRRAWDRGPEALAETFLSRWGETPYRELPPKVQRMLAARIPLVLRSGASVQAPPEERVSLPDLSKLQMPVTIAAGSEALAIVRAVQDTMTAALPLGRAVTLPGLGHMGPIAEPAEVATEIAAHLAAV